VAATIWTAGRRTRKTPHSARVRPRLLPSASASCSMPSTPFRVDAQECNNSSRLSGCCFDNATRRQPDARGTTLLVDALTISRRRATAIASTPRSAVQRPHRLPPAEHIPIGGARRVRRAGSSPCATAPRSRCPRPCRCAIPEPRAASRNGGRRGAITPSPCGDEQSPPTHWARLVTARIATATASGTR